MADALDFLLGQSGGGFGRPPDIQPIPMGRGGFEVPPLPFGRGMFDLPSLPLGGLPPGTDLGVIPIEGPTSRRQRAEKADKDYQEKQQQKANARQVGAQARGVAQVAPGAPIDKSSREAYLRTAMPYFQQVEAQTGIPAESLAAISINEGATAPGTLAYNSGAPFGIKSVGQDANGNDIHTGYPVTRVNAWEVVNGQNVMQPSAFINFPDPAAAIQGFVDFLRRNERYAPALQAAGRGTNPQEFNSLLAQAGYATDPNWMRNINSIAGEASGYRAATASAPAPALAPGGSVFPVVGYRGPITPHWGGVPGGMDIMAPEGTPIVAMRGGVDTGTGYYPTSGGNYVEIRGNDGNLYYYAHMQGPAQVDPGQPVEAGTPLGMVGRTGNARGTPPHLHLGIGPTISSGTGPQGGTGGNFDATSLLRAAYDAALAAAANGAP